MNKLLLLITLIFSACIGASYNNSFKLPSATADNISLPAFITSDLEGKKLHYPEDLPARHNLLIFAFKHEQQKNVDPWLKATLPLEKIYPGLRVIEIPVIENSSAAFRAMVNNGMRSGIKSSSARKRTQTLYIEKQPFLKHLKLEDQSQVYPLLFCSEGQLLWRTAGDLTPNKLIDLKNFLDQEQNYQAQNNAITGKGN